MRREPTQCPVCSAHLRGSRFTGYTCTGCHAHFSARFMARIHRASFKQLVNKHFTLERKSYAEVRSEHFMVPDHGEVGQVIEEARIAAQQTRHHLEELLDVSGESLASARR